MPLTLSPERSGSSSCSPKTNALPFRETVLLRIPVVPEIELHLAEKITRGDVAKHFFVSENTLSHIFRNNAGISFHRYVTLKRLEAAKALMDEDLQLKLVSRMVGFSDYSSFYRVFRQEYGLSPEQYRKRKNEGDSPL